MCTFNPGWVGVTNYISAVRLVPIKEFLFSGSGKGSVTSLNSGKGFKNTCLERDSCLSGKGLENI